MGVPIFGPLMVKLIGSRNQRMVKRYLRIVDAINALEPTMRALSDQELRASTDRFRAAFKAGSKSTELMPEIFAVAREAMDRAVGIRNILNPALTFDVATLPPEARRLHEQTLALIAATPPRESEGDLLGGERQVEPWEFVDIPLPLYEAVRELYPLSKPPYRARPFDVQLIGGMVLSEGKIAEMKTGEGKTIVAPLAAYLACLRDKQVHVVTVNDYLVQRDRDWTFPFFRALGLTVGAIHPHHMQPPERKKEAYECDVLYGTTSEYGFDYLRDNMKLRLGDQVQRRREFAIVDEVDSILIDEARTPLIISGPAHASKPRYDSADGLARHLVEKQRPWQETDDKVQSCRVEISSLEGDIRNARDKTRIPALKAQLDQARRRLPALEGERDRHLQYFEVELDKKKATVTPDGIAEAQRRSGLGSFYVGDNIDMPHLLEQAIRAHTVYQRDRDYVVATDEDGQQGVIIVDQNTGRKMVGRQWSDGLHQAVEAKERVRIKDETQTMATITIQNFFKLYGRLAGMTGTADTEATEFHEIYRLDVVSIPTNLPVVRMDRNDLVFLSLKDKWESIIDEIKALHDVGRPILVGTTSVEKSELLSRMLTQKHQIRHEVLNAKQHEREAEIVAGAGQLGAVMIATNMAGRGTDIKLGRFTRDQLVEHWKRRGIAPREVDGSMEEGKLMAAIFRHIAPKELDRPKAQVDGMSDEEVRLALLRAWAVEHCFADPRKAAEAGEDDLMDVLDSSGGCLLHRLWYFENIEDMGGLHIIGTERHESRRIDNQLRGRSGRQGDAGSSRFFLSLEDDLMKMFAGKATLGLLSKLGMKEGDAIESPMLTRAVEKAQRKVEERNFQIRKNILEYDEPMEHQRRSFYGIRQRVLEGRDVKGLILEYIEESIRDSAHTYLHPLHRAKCIAEWARENLGLTIEPTRFKNKDREDVRALLLRDGREDAVNRVRLTVGEYIFEGADRSEWDLKGLAQWAKSAFKAELRPEALAEMDAQEITADIEECALDHIEAVDLAPIDRFLAEDFGAQALAEWANSKFGSASGEDFAPDLFAGETEPGKAAERLLDHARRIYAKREVEYPIDFAIDLTSALLQQDPQQALGQFCQWVRMRYELDWRQDALPSTDPRELRRLIAVESATWDAAKIARRAEKAFAEGGAIEQVEAWLRTNVGVELTPSDRESFAGDPRGVVQRRIADSLRTELSQFEQWVMLQILDSVWKDHLHAMDQIRDAIGFRAFSQKDPRIEFKKEASRLFSEMQESIRDKVTDVALKGRLMPQVAPRPQQQSAAAPGPSQSQAGSQPTTQLPGQPVAPAAAPRRPVVATAAAPAIAAAAEMVAQAGTAAQQRDLEIAERAGAPEESVAAPRRAASATMPAVGRNEPCPCGSGKKFKQCHGAR
jgi:preprotein translocase subunit SecA